MYLRSRRPVTWAEYHQRRMDKVERSSIVGIGHALLFAALALAVFLV